MLSSLCKLLQWYLPFPYHSNTFNCINTALTYTSHPSHVDWTTLVDGCFRTGSQLVLHSLCQQSSWQMDRILPVMWICVQGRTAGQWHRPYDCPADLYSRPLARSASRLASDDIHRPVLSGTCPPIHGYFKTPLLWALKFSLVSKTLKAAVQNASKPASDIFQSAFRLFLEDSIDPSLGLMHHILGWSLQL